MRLKISARKSDLARLQAYMVGEALQSKYPGTEIEYRFKESLGDINLTDPLWKIPEKGVFTQDFYSELVNGETDMVVHSWKDLPTEAKPDTEIVATLPRADQRDLLLVRKDALANIRQDRTIRIFSSSPRRAYNLEDFLKTHLPLRLEKVEFENVRGNIPTRIRKLLESDSAHGLILAKAALDRLLTAPHAEFKETRELLRFYMNQMEWMVLPLSINPNAAAQGALAVEVASNRKDIRDLVTGINHAETFKAAQKERDILASFGGGCHQKIGIAVLSRPFGELSFLRGETDHGQVLREKSLLTPRSPPKLTASLLWSESSSAVRSPLAVEIPSAATALFVSRSEAWPDHANASNFQGLIWAAGLKTWKKLSDKGIWVHGCSDGLGEAESTSLETLAGKALNWFKLSHQDGYHGNLPVIGTYELQLIEDLPDFNKFEFFFWNSGSQFLQALEQKPELATKLHASGPGNTHEIIRERLKKNKSFDPSKLFVFLDIEDWRTQCTKN